MTTCCHSESRLYWDEESPGLEKGLTPPLPSPLGEEIKTPSPLGEGWGEVKSLGRVQGPDPTLIG